MKERIRTIMNNQHMSQQLFADFLGIAPATLSSIFTGRTRPTLTIIEAIKNKMPTISTDWLMFGIGDMFTSASVDDSATEGVIPSDGQTEPSLAFASPTTPPEYGSTMQPTRAEQRQSPVTVVSVDKPQRRITEIRIFYDDRTWETFVPQV